MQKNIFDNSEIWKWVDSNDENQVRFDFTEKLTPDDIKSIIDIGCGNGRFLDLISQRRSSIRCVGVDNSDGALEHINFEKKKASITDVPYSNAEFDCVCALEVLEHLNPVDFQKALSEMSRLSNKYVIISVPYMEDIEWNMAKCPNCFTKFHYDGHVQQFNEAKMESLMDGQNFKCVTYSRLGWSRQFKFHKKYVKLFYPEQRYRVPHYTVCPVCNTELGSSQNAPAEGAELRGSLFTKLKDAIRYFWPKEDKSYWIIALYQKNNHAAKI